jgi:hypothetical protein
MNAGREHRKTHEFYINKWVLNDHTKKYIGRNSTCKDNWRNNYDLISKNQYHLKNKEQYIEKV